MGAGASAADTSGAGSAAADLETFRTLKAAYEAKRAEGGEVSDADMLAHLRTAVEGAAGAGAGAAGAERHVPYRGIQDAIAEVVAQGKTPLVIDTSEDERVATFFSYQSCTVLEGKKMVMDKAKGGQVPDILEEARRKVVSAMKNGNSLMVRLHTSAPDFKGSFNSPDAFPLELFDQAQAQKSEALHNAIFREEDKQQGIILVRDSFHVFVVTKFSPEDYREFLEAGLPLEHMVPLIVDHEDAA